MKANLVLSSSTLVWGRSMHLVFISNLFLGGTKNGTDSDEMATRIYHQNFAPRIAPFDADERKHEIGTASRRKCFLKNKLCAVNWKNEATKFHFLSTGIKI